MRPQIGSTTPENVPKRNAFQRECPWEAIGIETAAPSGMFCKPMPIASARAEESATGFSDNPASPAESPTEPPSGRLWSVIARKRSCARCRLVFGPSGVALPG